MLRYGLTAALGVSLLVYALVAAFAPQIAGIFNSGGDPALQAIAEQGLRLYFLACPFAGCNVVASMYFTATERPLPAHAISLLRGFFLILPLAFLLSWLGGMRGIWLCFPATELATFLLAAALLLRNRKKKRSARLEHKKRPPSGWGSFFMRQRAAGAGNVTRTHDLLITNQLLYRLSYASTF